MTELIRGGNDTAETERAGSPATTVPPEVRQEMLHALADLFQTTEPGLAAELRRRADAGAESTIEDTKPLYADRQMIVAGISFAVTLLLNRLQKYVTRESWNLFIRGVFPGAPELTDRQVEGLTVATQLFTPWRYTPTNLTKVGKKPRPTTLEIIDPVVWRGSLLVSAWLTIKLAQRRRATNA